MTPAEQGQQTQVRRVKISDALLDELRREWSPPVQVRVADVDEDGDLELIFRTVPFEPGEPDG